MKNRLLTILLASVLAISVSACGGNRTSQDAQKTQSQTVEAVESQEEQIVTKSYIYEFEGMMGKEKAQFDLYADGSCEFFLPDNNMIKDIYAGRYEQEDNTVTISNLKNKDESANEQVPGLWNWISDGSCTIVINQEAGTFVPEGAESTNFKEDVDTAEDELKNISYASVSDSEKCDIYLPENVESAPVIVLVHGGGFMFGDQRMDLIQPIITAATQRGYAVVSVDYRKSSEAVFPAALSDVKSAIRFVKANADKYGFDSEHIAVWGESAGAYLSLMSALTPNVEELNGDVDDNSDVDSSVQAVVSFYAPVEFYTMYEDASVAEESFESKFLGQNILEDKNVTNQTYWETYADQLPTDIGVWIQVGDSDSRVPHTQSINLADRLKNYLDEGQIEFEEIGGADHEDPLFYTEENLSDVLTWLDGYLNN